MKAGILLLARTGSTRLPGKLLLEVLGRPIVEYQIERLKRSKRADAFVMCTTRLPEDDILVDLAARNGLACFRGSTDDVVERMVQAGTHYGLNIIVSIGGDDLFCDPGCVDQAISCFEKSMPDFVYFSDLPMGTSPYSVKLEALKYLRDVKTGGTDGWERYFEEGTLFNVTSLPAPDDQLKRKELRMTLDYLEDFQFFKSVFETLYPRNPRFALRDVIELIDRSPDLSRLCQLRAMEWYEQRAGFDVSLNVCKGFGTVK